MTDTLTTEAATAIIGEVVRIAAADGRTIVVAVADSSGWMLAVRRPESIGGLTADIAMAKAYTAALMGRSTRALREWKSDNPIAFVQLSALAGKTMIIDDGGLPLHSGDRVIGGVGLSGNPADLEHRFAEQALANLGYSAPETTWT